MGTWQEQPLLQVPCRAGGLQQTLLCTPHQGGLDRRADESCPCQGACPGGFRRHEAQAAARSAQGQEGWAGQAGVGTCGPRPSMAPMLTSQCSCCPLPQGFGRTPPSALPLPAQPQAACSPGVTP